MWNHKYAEQKKVRLLAASSNATKCLRDRHMAISVGDFVELAQLADLPRPHEGKQSCSCNTCAQIKTQAGCQNPHACYLKARAFLDTLPSKWDPRGTHPEDYEDDWQKKIETENEDEDCVPFDRRVTTYGHIGDTIRVFTEGEPYNHRLDMTPEEDQSQPEVVATDGSCLKNGEASAQAGAGIFFNEDDPRNMSLRLPESLPQTNQTGETVATLMATRSVPRNKKMIQETDSKTVRNGLTRWRVRQEDAGYIDQENGELMRATTAALRERSARTGLKWVKGHNGHARNEGADRLAGAGAQKERPGDINLQIDRKFVVTGAKLSKLSQRLAYKAVRKKKNLNRKARSRTDLNIARTQAGIEACFGTAVTEKALWKSLRHNTISKQAHQFLWMTMNDGYMVGDKWLRESMPPELQCRAICTKCQCTESSMDHILFDCDEPGGEIIWSLLRKSWSLAGFKDIEINWGSTLGAACGRILKEDGERNHNAEALWSILAVESLYLVWKLRCERVIQNGGREFTAREITNRWYKVIEQRLDLDRRSTKKSVSTLALKPGKVKAIWGPLLTGSEDLPEGWVGNSGVLVGIKGRHG